MAALRPGILKYRQDGQMQRAAVGGGYVEADASRVRLITEFFKRPEDIDLAAAQKDLEAAQAVLKELKATTDDVAYKDAEGRVDWALARIELAGGDTN
jgi:F0F1-type ATP synthase epsilon subunit